MNPVCPRRRRRDRTLTAFGLCLLAAALPAPVAAQHTTPAATAALAGTVTAPDAAGGLTGIAVELVELRLRRITGPDGRYAFRGLPAGEYTLRFSRLGHAVLEQPVRLEAGADRTVDVTLAVEAILLSPVMVLLERTRLVGDLARARLIPGSAHVIGSEQLDEQVLAFDDINAVLRQVPGVNLQEEEGFGARPNIGMRGTGTERSAKITVMEDGVLAAPAPYAAPAAYYFPATGRMEAIEVRKGSSQVKYGPRTIGGALNLVSTSIPPDFRVSVDAAGGPDLSGKLVARVGDTYRYGGWLLESYHLRTDGYKRLDGAASTGFEVSNQVAKARINTDRSGGRRYQELELKLARYDEVAHETYLGLTEADFRSDPLRRYAASARDRLTVAQSQAQLRHFAQPARWLDVTTTAYRNDMSRNWYKLQSVLGRGLGGVVQDPERYAAEMAVLQGEDSDADALAVRAGIRDYLSQGVQSMVGVRVGGFGVRHDLELGLRVHEDQEARFQHDDLYGMAGGRMVLTTAGMRGTQENRVSDARAVAFYLQDHLSFGPATLTAGVRHESIVFHRRDYLPGDAARRDASGVRENAVSVWIPGVGASLQLASGVRLLGGVHKGFGPPGPGAHADSKAETSVNYELGAQLQRGGASLEVVSFHSDYDNVLGASTLSSGDQGTGDMYNGGAVDVRGVEVSGGADLAGAYGFRLPVRLAYTFTRAEFLSDFESAYAPWGSVAAGDRLPYLPEHQLHASAGVGTDAWKLRVEGSYSSRMRTRAGQGPIPALHGTDAVLVFNLSGEHALGGRSSLYAGVQNLTDARYVVARQPAGARPGLPRTVQAGLRFRY
jgi:Fe(3+) dicitrate transport protein